MTVNNIDIAIKEIANIEIESTADIKEVIEGGYYGDNNGHLLHRHSIKEFQYKFKVSKDSRWMKLYENENFREIIEGFGGIEPYSNFCEKFCEIKEICFMWRKDIIKECFGENLTEEERAELEKQFDAYFSEVIRRAEELHPYELYYKEVVAERRVTPDGKVIDDDEYED